MSITIRTKVIIDDLDDLDQMDKISIQVSNSVTGFTVKDIHSIRCCNDYRDKEKVVRSWMLDVEGELEHLNGFETVDEFKRFMSE